MTTIEEVRGPLRDEWAGTTFPAFRPLLPLLGTGELGPEGDRPLACAATIDGAPAGLVLAHTTPEEPHVAELLSLFVLPAFRGRGIATDLLAELEQVTRNRYGVTQLTGVYMTSRPAIPALERVFAKRGFPPPVVRTVVLRFRPEEAPQSVWYRKARVPNNAEIFPWRDLSAEERDWLQQSQRERGWIDPLLEPWHYDTDCDPLSSVGMRYGGEVVGWVLNHRLAPDFVRFTISFMRSDLAARGAIFALYVASLEVLQGTGVTCSYVTPSRFARMVQFTLKNCKPFASFCGETRGVTKDLSADVAVGSGS